MKPTIRLKLFFLILGLIFAYVLITFAFNRYLLPMYYVNAKHTQLLNGVKTVDKAYTGDPTQLATVLVPLERGEGMSISIVDSTQTFYLYNSPRNNAPNIDETDPSTGRLGSIIKTAIKNNSAEITKKGYAFVKLPDRSNLSFIACIAKLNNGDYIFVFTPEAAINENAEIANKFSLFLGALILLIGGLLAFFSSEKFTKPVRELNEIAQKMSRLDFSSKYEVTSKDEIGELGTSINSLSAQLQQTIGELQEKNRRLSEDIEKERQIDQMRKEFIANVSHELKTPIALIQGYAEGLKINVASDEESRNYYCNVIMDEAAKMNKLTHQILNLSQIESGYMLPEKTAFNIGELVERIIKKNNILFKDKKIKIVYDKTAEHNVNADPYMIEQALSNYITNAADYVEKAGTIKVDAKEVNDKVRVSVFNSGSQINEAEKDKLWTSFYKADKARTRSYGGTGVGLAVVKAIIEAHGGSYGVQNLDNGVEFYFSIDKA